LKSIVQHPNGLVGVETGDDVGVDTGDKVGYPGDGALGLAVTGGTGDGVVGSPLLGMIVISAQFQNNSGFPVPVAPVGSKGYVHNAVSALFQDETF
jgi:hypothetical protein